jgi:hypothetical protein
VAEAAQHAGKLRAGHTIVLDEEDPTDRLVANRHEPSLSVPVEVQLLATVDAQVRAGPEPL